MPLEVAAGGKMIRMAEAPGNLRRLKRKRLLNSREIPRQFRSRAEEAVFWESHDFDPGVLIDGTGIRKELDELLGLKER